MLEELNIKLLCINLTKVFDFNKIKTISAWCTFVGHIYLAVSDAEAGFV